MASGCRNGHHFVTVNQRQIRQREVKRLGVNVCVRALVERKEWGVMLDCFRPTSLRFQARLSPGPSIQHRPLFSSHPDKLIHPPFLFLLLFFPSSSQRGCPLTDSAEKKRDVVPGKKIEGEGGRGGRRKAMRRVIKGKKKPKAAGCSQLQTWRRGEVYGRI